ncbi:MAG: NAD(P)-dependent oxidoreductase [Muribaculaceae bacterium]|nr:NAD(P)-dependent oxidoreductase [Muribaculaceae bacterium]
MGKKVLIVGAGGFIGGFIAAESLRRGFETTAGVRESTSRRFLTDPRLEFLTLDYDDPAALKRSLEGVDRFDYIVYNLGATKCANFADFNKINYLYLTNFTRALQEADRVPERFLYISSLSALGPGDEKGYTPLADGMIPNPNTRYGVSKIKAETHLDISTWLPWIVFRPTGVYGPHEQDYLMMIKSMDRGFDPGVGFKKQLLTFIYVEDLAAAVFDALERAPLHRKYILAEGRAYTQREFRDTVKALLGKKIVVPVRFPLWMLWAVSTVSEKIAALKMEASTLNRDKYRIMAQRNWDCDISRAVADWGFAPRFSLADGLAKTIEAYRAAKNQPKS